MLKYSYITLTGETALHIAAKHNCPSSAQLLLDYGLNVNDKNKRGE